MSNEAINWALTRPIKPSAAKFVLVVMANHADGDTWEAWPSVASLVDATGQDRKTVMSGVKRLVEMGYISDTGKRTGGTKQVLVYHLNSAENGTLKVNGTETGTVPVFPTNSTVFPNKQSQISLETVPKTVHGTQRNHQGTIKEPKTKPVSSFVLPDWVPADAWNGYLEMRKKKNKVPTDRARDLVIAELAKLRSDGHDLAAVLDKSTVNGWTDIYAPKPVQPARAGPGYQTANEKAKSWADRITGKTRHEQDRTIIDINDIPP